MAELIEVGDGPVNDAERDVIRALTEGLPPDYTLFPNVLVLDDRSAHAYECDAILIAPHAVYVIEIKGWRGRIRAVSNSEWQLPRGRIVRNPLEVTDHKARVLASVLRKLDLPRGMRAPFVQGCLIAGSDHAQFDIYNAYQRRALTPSQAVAYLTDPRQLDRPPRHDYTSVRNEITSAVLGRLKSRPAEPRRYGSYRVTDRVGGTDDTAVWLAEHAFLDDHRVYRIRTWFLSDYLYSDTERRRRHGILRRSAEALQRIGDHPNIAALRDFGDEEGAFYEVTDWTEFGTLATVHERGQLAAMPQAQRLGILRDVARGLAAAFPHKVFHRALSPQAILLQPDGAARITDFDRAFLEDATATVFGSLPLDDARWVPPELLDPQGYDVFDASDLYSLGRIALDLFGDDLPDDVVDLLDQVTVLDPQARDHDPVTFLAALEDALAPAPAESPNVPPPPPIPSPDAFQPGDVIDGQNTVIERLGGSRHAAVYLVHHEVLQDRFVLKIMLTDDATSPAVVFRTLRNVASDHLVGAHWSGWLDRRGDAPTRPYLLTEHVKGPTLRAILQDGALPLATAISHADDLLDALTTLHGAGGEAGALHRDLDASNIVVSERGLVVVDVDTVTPTNDAGAAPVASPAITPPDLPHGGWDPSCDTFAVGVLLYEMLVGVHPWSDGHPVAGTPARSAADLADDLPPPVAAFVDRAIAPTRDQRFRAAPEMREALREARDKAQRVDPAPSRASQIHTVVGEVEARTWSAAWVGALAATERVTHLLGRAVRDAVVPPAGTDLDALEDALVQTEAGLFALERPFLTTMPSLYALLHAGHGPVPEHDADATPGPGPADPDDRVLWVDGWHPMDAAAVRGAAERTGRTLTAWWRIDGVGVTAAADVVAHGADATPWRAEDAARVTTLDLPRGRQDTERPAQVLLERHRLLTAALEERLAAGVPVWIAASTGSVYLGHGLGIDVGGARTTPRAHDTRARWVQAFGAHRIGDADAPAPPADVPTPFLVTGGTRYVAGRLTWPPQRQSSWLQHGGLSLPERLLPLFRLA